MLKAIDIHKSYGSLHVLEGVDVAIDKGEIVSIVGKSGAGKSTLLHILGTLDQADKGQVLFNGKDISRLRSKELSSFRNDHIGFIFQFHHLLPEFTALENVCIPGFIQKRPEAEVKKRAKELLDYLGLSERLLHKPNQMSGGEQQRVAVAFSYSLTSFHGICQRTKNIYFILPKTNHPKSALAQLSPCCGYYALYQR